MVSSLASRSDTAIEIPDSEYFSFDYQYHRRLDTVDGINLMVPSAIGTIFLALLGWFASWTSAFLLLLLVALLGLALTICGANNPKLQILAQAREARLRVKQQLPPHPFEDTKARDWMGVSGLFMSDILPKTEKLRLEFTPFKSLLLKNKNPVYNITGKSEDKRFSILHGLMAENGALYWLERHAANPNTSIDSFEGEEKEGIERMLVTISKFRDRMVLVEGTLNYDTHRLEGVWKDSLGGTGTYTSLARKGFEIVATAE